MARSTSILGLARLERKLKRLPQAVLNEIRTAMEASAEEVVRLAKSLVPEDSGDLKESIGWTWGAPPRGSITLGKIARSALGKQLTLTIFAGNDKAYYARWVEFGTAAHSTVQTADASRGKRQGGTSQHPGSAAQPFFYPAWRANKKSVRSNVRKAVRSAALKVARGG